MTAFTNFGFEDDGGGQGSALGWTFSDADTVEEWASYNPQQLAYESFETKWQDNAGYIFAFTSPNTQLSAGIFATVHTDTKFVEDFEEKWMSNEAFVHGIPTGEFALYALDVGTSAFESFEQAWVAGYLTAFVGVGTDLSAGTFDGFPYDRFEQNWSSNSAYAYAFVGPGTDLTAAVFDTAPEDFEDFEDDWPTMLMTTV